MQIHIKCFLLFVEIKLLQQTSRAAGVGGSWLPLCGGIGYLAHEEDALGAVLHNEDQEGSVEVHGGRD